MIFSFKFKQIKQQQRKCAETKAEFWQIPNRRTQIYSISYMTIFSNTNDNVSKFNTRFKNDCSL